MQRVGNMVKMTLRNGAIDFIKFTIDVIKHNNLYKQMSAKD
jgi:hypothetical protein